jgi:hypothetical protein
MKVDWPSREEWAIQGRTAYCDEGGHRYTASSELSLYANPEEIATAIAALQKMWRDYGTDMRAAQKVAGPLARQSNERRRDWGQRWLAMTDVEQKLANEVESFRDKRELINRVIKTMRNNGVPWWQFGRAAPPPPLDAIIARYEAAVQAGDEKWKAEVAARPVDDAAWASELEHRGRIDQNYFFRVQ